MTDNHSEADFIPPTIEEIAALLPAYDVHSFIAKGGMGAVYMASQRSLDRPVAIKILPRHFGEDAEFRASFEAEAKSMAKLNHPNLIGIYDFGQVDGLLYIIMELVHGKSLYHSAYGQTVAPTEAARIVSEICRGLANAHKHGILHRDIKPSNILLDPSASPKIGDFGLARPVGEHESENIFGTPGYTAPEVLDSPAAVDESTDLYAVGIMLYELLTGKIPADTYESAATRTNCSPKFDHIIRKAIHPNPAMRFRSADEMADALEPLINDNASSNPLLAHAAKARTSATAKSAINRTHNKAAYAHSGKSTANHPVARNIIIIIALLIAIYVAWEGLKNINEKRALEQAELLAEQEKVQKENSSPNKGTTNTKINPTPNIKINPTPNIKINPTSPVQKGFVFKKAQDGTPQETLARLQPQLVEGIRTEFPKGSILRTGRVRFFVEEKMTWRQAQEFCENHGGHLAILPKNADLTWLTSKLGFDDSIWLGAGTSGDNQWCWIDGTSWGHEIRNTTKSAYVSTDQSEVLIPNSGSALHSFFIEWNADASTPASFTNQLKRMAESINATSPSLPAGTVSFDGGSYLLINKALNWKEALELAHLAGGVLATPTTLEENDWVLSFVSSNIQENQACWIGGSRPANGTWAWANAEPWAADSWASDTPNANTSSPAGCAIISSGAWKDYPTNAPQAYFLIEWSKTKSAPPQVKGKPLASDDIIEAKREMCANLLSSIQARHEKNFTSNIKGYEQKLRSFSRGLPNSLKQAYAPVLTEMKNSYQNNRIPDDLDRESMPKKAAGILDFHLDKQNRITAKLLSDTEDLRENYQNALHKAAQDYKSKNLTSNLRQAEEEIKNTQRGGSAFVEYITGKKK